MAEEGTATIEDPRLKQSGEEEGSLADMAGVAFSIEDVGQPEIDDSIISGTFREWFEQQASNTLTGFVSDKEHATAIEILRDGKAKGSKGQVGTAKERWTVKHKGWELTPLATTPEGEAEAVTHTFLTAPPVKNRTNRRIVVPSSRVLQTLQALCHKYGPALKKKTLMEAVRLHYAGIPASAVDMLVQCSSPGMTRKTPAAKKPKVSKSEAEAEAPAGNINPFVVPVPVGLPKGAYDTKLKMVSTDEAQTVLSNCSQAVSYGGILYVSGIVAMQLDEEGNTLTVSEQVDLVLKTLEKILVAGGSTMQHVIKYNVYLKNADLLSEADAAIKGKFGDDYTPARTTLIVSDLPHGGDVAIDAQAAIA